MGEVNYQEDPSQVEFVIFECFGEGNIIFKCHGENNAACVRIFEKSRLFDGKTIYEADNEITVLYG